MQPLLADALSLGDGHLMCLGIQLIETLSEAVQVRVLNQDLLQSGASVTIAVPGRVRIGATSRRW